MSQELTVLNNSKSSNGKVFLSNSNTIILLTFEEYMKYRLQHSLQWIMRV